MYLEENLIVVMDNDWVLRKYKVKSMEMNEGTLTLCIEEAKEDEQVS